MLDILDEIINKPYPLSDEQKQAVLSEEKYVRVIAGAGTGKTETLTRRIIYLLLYCNIEPGNIVAFTFTERAAQSMKGRIYQRVKQLEGREVCAKLGEMYVGTIHGYCLRILQDYFGYGDQDVLDENQEIAFVMREGWRIGLNKGGNYIKNCRNFIRSVNVIYDELIDRKELEAKAPDFYMQFKKYEDLLDKHRLLTFGRMIAIGVEKIEEKPEKIAHIKHLIVDEYQDINKAQEKLIKLIGNYANVFIVGDPRQSIYQWRGSNVKCFDNFTKLFEKVETFTLRENRRSAKQIVDVANTFADTFDVKYEHIHPMRGKEGVILQAEFETPDVEAKWVIEQIERYVKKGKCRYADCAILLRSVTTSADPFIKQLKKRNIPYIVGGKVGLFRREEAKAMGYFFSWLWDEGFWIEDMYNKWREKTRGDKLLEKGIKLWCHATGFKLNPKKKLKRWKEDVLNNKFENFTEVFHELLTILNFRKLNPDNKNHAAIMANLGRFSTLLADYESSIRRGGNKPNWRNAVKGLCWYMNAYATGAYEEQPSEDIRGIDAVQIMTIHQAKGLEWSIVFIPCMVEGRFPSRWVGSQQRWFIPRNIFDVGRYEGNIEDEKRLFYVAITRARDILCVSWFNKKKKATKRSQFLNDIAQKLKHIKSAGGIPSIEISPSSIEDEMKTFSAGEILTYVKCPYLYRLRELWAYKPGLVEALGYGKSLHYCLRYIFELISQGENIKSAVERAIDEKFHIPYASAKVRENMKNKAKELLFKFVREHEEDIGKIEEMEVRVEFPLEKEKSIITGRVDVIFKSEGSMEVRDYKTSDEVTTFEQASLQVQLYSLGLIEIGKSVTQASIGYIEDGRLEKVDINFSNLENARKKAEECIKNILRGRFKPELSNSYCINCDYTKICRYNKKYRR